ncbi:hypothetical protein BDP27DRAFT_1224793, partial [Rhodocollybia butyracea]
PPLLSAYNAAALALKKLRDSHIVIVTRYITAPAARARRVQPNLKGSVGTELTQFSKAVRDETKDAVINSSLKFVQ